MNKSRKRRQRRKARDLRWIARGLDPALVGLHRYKKFAGELSGTIALNPEKNNFAFWRYGRDPQTTFSKAMQKALPGSGAWIDHD